MSQLEAFYARGDKNLSQFIYKLYENGAYLESWDENLDFELYQKVAKELNIDIEDVQKDYNGSKTVVGKVKELRGELVEI